jgi:hypothetical protein
LPVAWIDLPNRRGVLWCRSTLRGLGTSQRVGQSDFLDLSYNRVPRKAHQDSLGLATLLVNRVPLAINDLLRIGAMMDCERLNGTILRSLD